MTGPGAVVHLLGPPRIERDGRVSMPDTRKAVALLAYLALASRPVGRDEAVALLWPESDATRGRGALRRTLSALAAAVGPGAVVAEADTLRLDEEAVWVDVRELRRALAGSREEDAAELYGGPFLGGFGLRDSVEFDEWQAAAAEDLRRGVSAALGRLVESAGEPDRAIALARRWVDIDPLAEAAHRALIRLHAAAGDRAAAVAQYRECVRVLERELGLSPGQETTQAVEAAQGFPASSDASAMHELMGDLLRLQGRYADAERRYETAAALGAGEAAIAAKIGDVRHRLGEYEAADALYARALAGLDAGAEKAVVLSDRALNAHRRGDAEAAAGFAAQALAEAEASGDDRARAQAHNTSGILAGRAGDPDRAMAHLETSLDLAERLGDAVATAATLNNMALALRATDVDRALGLARRALDLCVRVGDRHREAAMHSNLADLLRAAGRDDEARSHLRLSAAIFADVGAAEGQAELRPEVWKLVEW